MRITDPLVGGASRKAVDFLGIARVR